MKKYHEIDLRQQYTISWKHKYPEEIQMWENRHDYVLHGERYADEVKPTREYMIWFKSYTKYLSSNKHLRDPHSQQPESLDDTPENFEVLNMSATTQQLSNMDIVTFYDNPPYTQPNYGTCTNQPTQTKTPKTNSTQIKPLNVTPSFLFNYFN
jgi:hypothetical protein